MSDISDEMVERIAIDMHCADADDDTVKWSKQPGKYRATLRRDVRDVLAAVARLKISLPPAPARDGVEPVAWIEREVLKEIAKHWSATGTVCSPLFQHERYAMFDKVALYAEPVTTPDNSLRERVAVLEKALERICQANPSNTNSWSPQEAFGWCAAVGDTALSQAKEAYK